MIRTIWLGIRLLFYMIGIVPKLWRVKRLTQMGNMAERDAIVGQVSRDWGQFVMKLTGSRVEVIGKAHLPAADVPLVVVANHQSAFDIPLLTGFLDRPVTFISKKENANLPFVGEWIAYSNCVLIDRGNRRAAVTTMNTGADIIRNGHTQALFAEGARTRDGQLQAFKPGAFKLAKKADAAVLPVAISGAYKLMAKGAWSIRPQRIRLVICPLIDTADLTTHQIAEQSRAAIAEQLARVEENEDEVKRLR